MPVSRLYADIDTPSPESQQSNSLDTSEPDGKERRKQNLKPFEGKWKLGKTRTIRVPEAIADRVLEYARQLDEREGNPEQS